MTSIDRSAYASQTILADGIVTTTDAWETQLNNNILVLGPSGSGKTRGHLMPNILQMGSSFLVVDVKGSLFGEMGPVLRANGYRVECIDLTEPCRSTIGYDPLRYVRMEAGRPNTLDVRSVAEVICPVERGDDPYWDRAAGDMVAACITYVLEQLPPAERTFDSALYLADHILDGSVRRMFMHLEETDPSSKAYAAGRRVYANDVASKMLASTAGVMLGHVTPLLQDEVTCLYTNPSQVDFAILGRERSALFVVVDDLDHTLAPLVTLLVSQAIRELFALADASPRRQLPVPVRLMLDDFANLRIDDIDDVLAVARSRELWVTIICQTVTQLRAIYGDPKAASIVGNCDTQILLACQDFETAQYFSYYADLPASQLLRTTLDRCWVFTRGRPPRKAAKLDVSQHPRYAEMLLAASAEQPPSQGLQQAEAAPDDQPEP